MSASLLIVPILPIPTSTLPNWNQLPPQRQQELITTLALLLLHLPEVQALQEQPDEPHQ
jgi:hypothetical protein